MILDRKEVDCVYFLSQTRSKIKIYVGMTKIDIALVIVEFSYQSVQRPYKRSNVSMQRLIIEHLDNRWKE